MVCVCDRWAWRQCLAARPPRHGSSVPRRIYIFGLTDPSEERRDGGSSPLGAALQGEAGQHRHGSERKLSNARAGITLVALWQNHHLSIRGRKEELSCTIA